MYGTSMQCIKNEEDLKIWGNYDAGAASNLMIVFEKCDSSEAAKEKIECASEPDIDAWIEGRYIITL